MVSVDDATWRDLEIGRYLDMVAAQTSLLGRQMLWHRLRACTRISPEERLFRRWHPGAQAAGDEAALDAACAALQPLRSLKLDLVPLLFSEGLPQAPRWVRHLWVVPLGFTVAVLLAAVGSPWPAAAMGLAALAASARIQILLHGAQERWQRERSALVLVLQAARDSALAGPHHPLLLPVQGQAAAARQLLESFQAGWVDRTPALADYANLIALTQYRRWARDVARLPGQRPALRQVYEAVAALEADLTLRAHLQRAPQTCAALPASARDLVLIDVAHPLLTRAQPLTLQLEGLGAFVTGQNGAGKSTLLRSVGLNVIIGQAFGFCYAKEARVPRVPVCSSLQVEDSLGTATSLYMAELQRARWLCEVALQPGGALVLIDEIFRGTNPQESMAATAALALELATTALLILATHHRLLAAQLGPWLWPCCVTVGDEGALRLQPGVLERTNGLAMLADYGFSARMQAEARRVFESLQDGSGHPTPQR